MSRPKALDLFCGAGGAAMGLYRAGFDVVGVDIKPQPRYPFPFVRGDALRPPMRLEDFDLVWASPPCQGYSIMRNLPWLKDKKYPLLIPAVRNILRESGAAFIIENVNQARRRSSLPEGISGGYLCGTMFGLPLYRHRRFETHRPRQTAKQAMGVEWMKNDEATQAIPPAYSEHIGKYAMMALGRA